MAKEIDENQLHYRISVFGKDLVDFQGMNLSSKWRDGCEVEKTQFRKEFSSLLLACGQSCWRSGLMKDKLQRCAEAQCAEWVREITHQ